MTLHPDPPGSPGQPSQGPADAGGTQAKPPPTRRHPVLRTLRFLFGLVVQVVLLALVLVLLVLGTQTGLRTAVAVGEELAPGVFSVGRVDGRVLGRLHLEDLEVHLPALDLALGTLDLDWSPLGALAGTLRVRELSLRDVDVALAPAEEKESEPLVLPEVVLPIAIEIDEALVERLKVSEQGAENPMVAIERAVLGARAQGSELDLRRLEVAMAEPRLDAQAQGQVSLAGDYPLGLDLDWRLALPPSAELTGSGRIGGDLGRLSIEHRIDGSVRLRIDAQVEDPIEAPSWDGEIRLAGVDLPDFAPDAPAVDLTARLATRGDLERATLTGTLSGKAPDLPDFGDLRSAVDLRWEDRVLTIDALDLDESVSGARLRVKGGLDLRPQVPTFDLRGSWEQLRWPLTGDLIAESAKGNLAAAGTLEDYDYSLDADAAGPDLPGVALTLRGAGDQQGTQIESLELRTLDGVVTASGTAAWAPEPSWDLKLAGEGLNPKELAPTLEDRIDLRLESKGDLEGYGYDLAVTTRGPGLPPARLALGGTGDLKGTTLDLLRLEALKGSVEGKGRATWDPEVTWDATLEARDLDPGAYAPEWPGRIGGRIATEGTLEPEGPALSARIEGMEGVLRGYPVAAEGMVRMAGRSIQVEEVRASSGPSTARVDGSLELPAEGDSGNGTLDLAFDLASPDLASLLPEARGSVAANGRLTGDLKQPELKLELSAENAEVAGQGIGSLSGRADIALTPEGRFDLSLDGSRLVAGGMLFDTLSVRGDGSMPSHRLSVGLSGEQLSAQLEASGALAADGAYQGELGRLDLTQQDLGAWRLERPTPIRLNGEQIAAGPLCLRDTGGSGGCLGFEQTAAGRWSADIDLDKLAFDLVSGFLPPTMTAEGAARVKGRFQADGPSLTGDALAEIPEGRVRVRVGAGKEQVLDFSTTKLNLDSGAKGIAARLAMPLEGLGEVSARLDLPGWRLDDPARPEQPLRGGVEARLEGLDQISDLVPDLTGVTGSIDADLDLGGTLAEPRLTGQANARALGAEVPLIGLKLSDLNLGAVVGSQRLDIQGQGDLGGGRLEVSGEFVFGPSGVAGELRAGGERLRIADTKEFLVVASPSFDLRVSPTGTQVRGEVKIPEARIRPRGIPAGTVSPSADVETVEQARDEKEGLPLDIDVKLTMGDDVTIDAFGVRGRLTGALRVFQPPGKELLGDGQLAIVDGFYRITAGLGLSAEIGAPLTIEQGRLIYAKSPIGNPGLLLQAQREGGDTTAGVRVLGTIRNPKLAFFSDSDPEMSRSEITTYLLTGVPPKRDGEADHSLSLGTYVAPKLYMEYENALGDAPDKVKLRYDLSRRIELQTETGESQGGDIFYKFER